MFILTKNNQVEVDPRLLWIPEFREVYKKDRTDKKQKANREFAYIYFMSDFKSEYEVYGIDKQRMICRDIMENETWEPDSVVTKAVEKYKELQKTTSMRYLESVRTTAHSMIKYHEDLMYNHKTQNAKDYDPTPAINGMKKMDEIMNNLEKWEKKVFSEEDGMKIRGGGDIGIFEDKESATWLKKVKS